MQDLTPSFPPRLAHEVGRADPCERSATRSLKEALAFFKSLGVGPFGDIRERARNTT
jgi:hypothetical protein